MKASIIYLRKKKGKKKNKRIKERKRNLEKVRKKTTTSVTFLCDLNKLPLL